MPINKNNNSHKPNGNSTSIGPMAQTPWTLGATEPASQNLSQSQHQNLISSPNVRGKLHTTTSRIRSRLGTSVSKGATSTFGSGSIKSGAYIGMRVNERTPSPHPIESTTQQAQIPAAATPSNALISDIAKDLHYPFQSSLYENQLLNYQPSVGLEAMLKASCMAMKFDIAEVWLRTGHKTHQLINTYLRHTALDETLRDELVDVYYGETASARIHRLSPALCRKAKVDKDVVWITADTESGAKALNASLNKVKTAVAVPVCHEASNSNITIIYFSFKNHMSNLRSRSEAIEFLVHTSLAAAVAGVHRFSEYSEETEDEIMDSQHARNPHGLDMPFPFSAPDANKGIDTSASSYQKTPAMGSPSAYFRGSGKDGDYRPQSAEPKGQKVSVTTSLHPASHLHKTHDNEHEAIDTSRGLRPVPLNVTSVVSANTNDPAIRAVSDQGVSSGINLNLSWNSLRNMEYLCDGGNNWIHTGVMNNIPIVIKQLRPEVADLKVAMVEIEDELKLHSLLRHENIVALHGAGFNVKNARFLVLERLDGGTLTQKLGYASRIRDRRRRFWKKHKMPYAEVLDIAMQIALGMDYCHRQAVENCMVLHRDLKPDNIGLTLGGKVKIIDFGLARLVSEASPNMDEIYELSGETGSLRYMAPEVAKAQNYNHKADVYSFGVILWELNANEKPFDGMSREDFNTKVVQGGYRPDISKKIPEDLANLIRSCWSEDIAERPNFDKVAEMLGDMLARENDKKVKSEKKPRKGLFRGNSGKGGRTLTNRHSSWF